MGQWRAWWSQLNNARRAIYLALLAGVLASLLAALALGATLPDLLLNLGAGLLGALVVLMALDRRPGSQEMPFRATEELNQVEVKTDLIGKLGSDSNEEALFASRELRRRDWLTDGSLQGAFLVEANLQEAALDGVNLARAFLFGANLNGASLSGARLQGANLYEARLQGAVLKDASLQGANLFRAHLQQADLAGANLQGAILGGTSLQAASLERANLQGAILGGTNLQETNLMGARLQRANLEGARLQGALLDGAVFDENTILPDGTRWTPDADLSPFTTPTRELPRDIAPTPVEPDQAGVASAAEG